MEFTFVCYHAFYVTVVRLCFYILIQHCYFLEKRQILHPVPSTSTSQSLITHITKNSQNGAHVNGTSVGVNDSYSADSYDDTGGCVPVVSFLVRIGSDYMIFQQDFN